MSDLMLKLKIKFLKFLSIRVKNWMLALKYGTQNFI